MWLTTFITETLNEVNRQHDAGIQAAADAKKAEKEQAAEMAKLIYTKELDLYGETLKTMDNSWINPQYATVDPKGEGRLSEVMNALRDDPKYSWLLDPNPENIGRINAWFKTFQPKSDKLDDTSKKIMEQFFTLENDIRKAKSRSENPVTAFTRTIKGASGPQNRFTDEKPQTYTEWQTSDEYQKFFTEGNYRKLLEIANTFDSINDDGKSGDFEFDQNFVYIGDVQDNAVPYSNFKFVGNNNPTSYAHFSNNASSMLSALKSAQDQGELEKYFEGFGGKEKFTYDIATKLQDDISQVYIQFNKEMTAAGSKGQGGATQSFIKPVDIKNLTNQMKSITFLSEYDALVKQQNDGIGFFENLENRVLTEIVQQNNENGQPPTAATINPDAPEGEQTPINVTYQNPEQFVDIFNKMKLTGTAQEQFNQFAKLFPNTIGPSMKQLKLAQSIANIPGVFTQLPNSNEFQNNLAGGYNELLSGDGGEQIANQIAVRLLSSPLSIKQQVEALSMVMYQANEVAGLGFSTDEEFGADLQAAVVNLAGASSAKTYEKLSSRKTENRDLLRSLKQFEALQVNIIESGVDDKYNPLAGTVIYTGFVGKIDRFFVNVFGNRGQISQLKDMFTGGPTDYQKNELLREIGEGLDDETRSQTLERMYNFIRDENKKGYAYGRAAALEVFLAYKMAKYFDPTGRVSDKDYTAALSQIAGSSAVGRAAVLGMIAESKGRVERDFEKLSVLVVDNPNSATPQQVRRVKAGVSYFGLLGDNKEIVKQLDDFKVNTDKHGLKKVGKTEDGKVIFQVFLSQGEDATPAFIKYGGLFVVRNLSDGENDVSGYTRVLFDKQSNMAVEQPESVIEYKLIPNILTTIDGQSRQTYYKIIDGNVVGRATQNDDGEYEDYTGRPEEGA